MTAFFKLKIIYFIIIYYAYFLTINLCYSLHSHSNVLIFLGFCLYHESISDTYYDIAPLIIKTLNLLYLP